MLESAAKNPVGAVEDKLPVVEVVIPVMFTDCWVPPIASFGRALTNHLSLRSSMLAPIWPP